MDPQKLSQLDPKLREAYQRVMGTSIPQPQVAPASPTPQRGEPIQTQSPAPMPTPPIPDPAPTPTSVPEPVPTPIPNPQPSIQTPVSEPQSIPTSEPPIIPEPQPVIPQPQPPPAGGSIPEPAIPTPPAQANNFVQMNSEVAAAPSSPNFTAPMPVAQTVAIKKKNHLLPIIIGVAGLVFVAIYTLFWTKIFNFKLPFLP